MLEKYRDLTDEQLIEALKNSGAIRTERSWITF